MIEAAPFFEARRLGLQDAKVAPVL